MASPEPHHNPVPEFLAPQPEPEPLTETLEPLSESDPALPPERITFETLRNDPEIITLINASDAYLETIGYTDHGLRHLDRVARRAYNLLRELELPQRECELAAISGLLHDVGNVVHRNAHPQHSAHLCLQLLRVRGMPMEEVAMVMGAVANHGDDIGEPISNPSAALIIADKSDVLRSRVRNPRLISFDIHDRVNYAAERSEMAVNRGEHLITLSLQIDTRISQLMEYFEIFMDRMRMCRRSANFLNCDFRLIINQVQLL